MGCQIQPQASIATPSKQPQQMIAPKQAKPRAGLQSENQHILDIPVRLQWQNHHGYCGETSIQACSIYYGNYIGQLQVRNISQGQILLGVNAQATIQKLGYQIQKWDVSQHEQNMTEYKKYLQWIKTNLSQGYPVIICGYTEGQTNQEYDHIYLAVGYVSENVEQYSDQDQLIYMDLFDKQYTRTKFGEIWDTRQLQGNGKNLAFAIPKENNYGVAIKGVKDQQEQFLPIRLYLQQNSEPNASVGEKSKIFEYKVVVSDLQEGKSYALLRYDNYKSIPKGSVIAKQAKSVEKFVAQDTTYEKVDRVDSNASVFYRCVLQENLQ